AAGGDCTTGDGYPRNCGGERFSAGEREAGGATGVHACRRIRRADCARGRGNRVIADDDRNEEVTQLLFLLNAFAGTTSPTEAGKRAPHLPACACRRRRRYRPSCPYRRPCACSRRWSAAAARRPWLPGPTAWPIWWPPRSARRTGCPCPCLPSSAAARRAAG